MSLASPAVVVAKSVATAAVATVAPAATVVVAVRRRIGVRVTKTDHGKMTTHGGNSYWIKWTWIWRLVGINVHQVLRPVVHLIIFQMQILFVMVLMAIRDNHMDLVDSKWSFQLRHFITNGWKRGWEVEDQQW